MYSKDDLKKAFLAGFSISAEGWNEEYCANKEDVLEEAVNYIEKYTPQNRDINAKVPNSKTKE